MRGEARKMSKYDVLMDVAVFTDIVNEIKNTASDCVLSDDPLNATEVWKYTDVGNKMNRILEKVYKSSEVYGAEASKSLPQAFLKMRDSMINVDEAAGASLKINDHMVERVK